MLFGEELAGSVVEQNSLLGLFCLLAEMVSAAAQLPTPRSLQVGQEVEQSPFCNGAVQPQMEKNWLLSLRTLIVCKEC